MVPIVTRRIKAISGIGSGKIKITPTPLKRLHGLGITVDWTGATTSGDTIGELLAGINAIRVLVGSVVIWNITSDSATKGGTRLRDWLIGHGTTHDCDYITDYKMQIYLPFAPDWYIANVADTLALDPSLLGGAITVEIDFDTLNSINPIGITAFERTSNDLGAYPTAGHITLDTITPVGGGTAFYVEREIAIRGRLAEAIIYPATGTGTYAVQRASLQVGSDDQFVYEDVADEEAFDLMDRAGNSHAASGRSASLYDIMLVRGDALAHSVDLEAFGSAKIQCKNDAGNSFVGTVPMLLVRIESQK